MIMEDILKSQQEQQALEEAPKKIDAVQQQIVVILEALLANPRFKRKEVLGLIKFVIAPKSGVQIRQFRKLLAEYGKPDKSAELVAELSKLMSTYGTVEPQEPSKQRKKLEREDLRLICFDHICGG